MFLFQPGTSKSTFKECYSNVPFSARDLKRYIMRILHARTFSAHFLRIFMRTYFFSPWTSRVYKNTENIRNRFYCRTVKYLGWPAVSRHQGRTETLWHWVIPVAWWIRWM